MKIKIIKKNKPFIRGGHVSYNRIGLLDGKGVVIFFIGYSRLHAKNAEDNRWKILGESKRIGFHVTKLEDGSAKGLSFLLGKTCIVVGAKS